MIVSTANKQSFHRLLSSIFPAEKPRGKRCSAESRRPERKSSAKCCGKNSSEVVAEAEIKRKSLTFGRSPSKVNSQLVDGGQTHSVVHKN